jgi:hypothetical protein
MVSIGQKYGRREVIASASVDGRGRPRWVVRCECGREGTIREDNLPRAYGCRHCMSGPPRKHGLSKTTEYKLWALARCRARRAGLPFTIKIEDVKIPETCPLLGVKLGYKDGDKTCSPSLDRIRSDGGYTPENVWVISWRANLIKTNLTLEQFEKFVAALRIAYKES